MTLRVWLFDRTEREAAGLTSIANASVLGHGELA
jgi:hypothetical protein